jgi:RNA polymerase sigma factor (sigma-70 family)
MFRKATQTVARPEVSEILVEELFLQRYDQMLEWALHLMDHRAAQAEDLVHDAFVQLTLSPPDFKTIENLDGYLFVVLRNLHRSQMQRAMRGPVGPEMLVDYDSALAGLKATDPRQHWQAVEELQLVCRYACARKESSKAGSVLILRFFHGYYPGEVAALLCVSRPAVKELLRMARSEAKLWLEDPAKLGFHRETAKAAELKSGASREETLVHLRQTIFAARQGRCLERQHLAEIYAAAQPELLTVPLLAHLVSCPSCLEEVNRLLKLSPLSDRDPNDMLGPDRGAQASHDHPKVTPFGAPTKIRARQRMLKKYRQRLRDVYEHEPQELRIAVNGFVLARQEITAPVHKQTLGIEVAEELSLIEVLSEQGVRLLALHVVPPPAGAFEQQISAEFSEGRTLTAQLNFCGSWPHLEIIYECGARNAECGVEESLPQFLLKDSSLEQGFLSRLYSALRIPHSAFRWVTITILLAALLITVVVGQKLGWWFAPAKPTTTPTPHAVPSDKPLRESPPAASPALAPSVNAPAISPALASSASPAPSAANTVATSTMEIEALRLLQQAGADLGEQIEVKRTAQGQLRIEGIVESEARKAELQRALASILAHPAVHFQIETVAEALARQRKAKPNNAANATPSVASRIEVEKAALPIAAELQAYLQARGSTAADIEVQELATRLHTQARRAFDHLYALQRLTKQVSPAQFDALDRNAQVKFLGLLTHHAQGYNAKAQRWRTDLAVILRVATPASATPASFQNTVEFYRAITQLSALGKAAALALDQSLTIANQPISTTTVKSPAFWRTVSEAENLALRIEQYAKLQTEKEP